MSESTAHSDPGYPAALIVYYISLYAFYSQSLDHHPLFWLGTVWPPFFLKKRVIILLNNSKRWNWEALEFRLVIVPGQGRWMLVKSELFMHCTHHPPGSVQPGHGPLLQHHTHTLVYAWTHTREVNHMHRVKATRRRMPRNKLIASESDGKDDTLLSTYYVLLFMRILYYFWLSNGYFDDVFIIILYWEC